MPNLMKRGGTIEVDDVFDDDEQENPAKEAITPKEALTPKVGGKPAGAGASKASPAKIEVSKVSPAEIEVKGDDAEQRERQQHPLEVHVGDENEPSYTRVMTMRHKHGKCGSYTYDDGTLFIGDFDERGIKSGKGHMEMENGTTFDGHFQKGLPNGVGVMRFPDSSRYEGEFMQGWFHGHGIYHTIDGMKFEGEFRGGRIWGMGLLSYPDGASGTEGYFQDSRFSSREQCAKESILKARKIAAFARRLNDEAEFGGGGEALP